MSRINKLNMLAASIVVSAAGVAVAHADANPFASTDLSSGYQQLAQGDGKPAEGKCGEGKCGEGKCGEKMEAAEKAGEGKCGEAMKGKDKPAEGKCGAGKAGEGRCGEADGSKKK